MAMRSVAAIVGGDTLIGRELNELLSDSGLADNIRLVSCEPDAAQMILDAGDEEAAIMAPLAGESLRGADVVFLAGSPESSRRTLDIAPPESVMIDLTGALEETPRARLRAPYVEDGEEFPVDAVHVVAHSAAVALALVWQPLVKRYPMSRAVVEVFEPASALGQRGIQELQKQTVNLLSFKPLPKEVYDTQLGFNLLASFGSEAPDSLCVFEQRIERHLATLLGKTGAGPMPSLRLIQAPVFHGYSLSIWAEFENNPGPDVLAAMLAGERIDVRGSDEEPPDNVGIAGQSVVAVGNIRIDRNDPNACWMWLVADNLRLQAENAVAVAREFL